jgi:hypothetical protein
MNNREHITCSFVDNCVLQENLYEMKLFLYEMGFCVINLMQLRENKPRLRNITFFYKQNKVLYMLPRQLLLTPEPLLFAICKVPVKLFSYLRVDSS